MECKTTKINGKRYVLNRIENGAWEFAVELTEDEWQSYCRDIRKRMELAKERSDLWKLQIKKTINVAGEMRLTELNQILATWNA